MPFCPSCRAEYKEGVTHCAECNEELVQQLADHGDPEEMIDVYACYDQQQAERLVGLLRDQNLHVLVRDRTSRSFPTNVGKTNQQVIAVPRNSVNSARSVIEGALEDEVLPANGEFLV